MSEDFRNQKMTHEEVYEAITAEEGFNPLGFTVRTLDAQWVRSLAKLEAAELEALQQMQESRAKRLARSKDDHYEDHGQSWSTEASLRGEMK